MTKEEQTVLVIENAQTELQRLLSQMIIDLLQRQVIGRQAKLIINRCLEELQILDANETLIEQTETGLKSSFTRWYEFTTQQLLKMASSENNPLFLVSYKTITGITPDDSTEGLIFNMLDVEGVEKGNIKNIRDFFTTGETGYSQMFIENYQFRVNQEIRNIVANNVTLRDRRNRKMSVRNLAEMEVRFQELKADEERLKAKGVKYAYATSHANASKRCQIWQGKLFILDGGVGTTRLGSYVEGYVPKPIGKIDGIEYYSLADAIEHGFLGYNCRHRLIAYRKGMTPPREYSAEKIEAERSKEHKIRALENQIRHAKRAVLFTDDKEQRKALQEHSKALQEAYIKECESANYAIAEWRTRVSLDERELIDEIETLYEEEDEFL